jgi:hypothetical protein
MDPNHKSQNRSVTIATGYGLNDWGQLPEGARYIYIYIYIYIYTHFCTPELLWGQSGLIFNR